jgi:hypothetical protein
LRGIVQITARAIVIAALCLASLAAKPAKSPPLTPAPVFFKPTGEPFELEKPFPGVTAALTLSDEQKIALQQAHGQTVRNPQLRNQISGLERKDNPTDAERRSVATQMDEARVELRKRVEAILSPQQRELAEKIHDAAVAAEHEANEIFDAELDAARNDPAKAGDVRKKAWVEAEDLLVQKLEKFLTPAQMQAIQRSAAEQRAARETAPKK